MASLSQTDRKTHHKPTQVLPNKASHSLKLLLGFCIAFCGSQLHGASASTEAITDEGIRGVVRARHEALLSADIKASIASLPVRPGEPFSEGDLLVAFNCTAQYAEAEAARAVHSAAKSRFLNSVEMRNFDALGSYDLDLAKAEMDEADARARAARARTRQCRITAPYSGRVAELAVNAHETPAPDTPLMKIVGTNSLELRLIVPSAWLNWLESGTNFEFEIDETGRRHKAEVTNIGAEVDAVSRTISIIAVFADTPATVLPGMSGTARFVTPTAVASVQPSYTGQ